jgi:hypothetical protein
MPAPSAAADYVNKEGTVTPIVGKPIYTFFAYKWGGLEAATGDPVGYIGNQKSKDYQAIIDNTPIDSLLYKGNLQPSIFGAMLNSVSWKNFSLSANVSYSFNYSVRKPVLHYNSLYNGWSGHSDYTKRWQNSGDEMRTNVPSQVYTNYPNFFPRESFYQNSEVPIIKGDHIKIDNVAIDYVMFKRTKGMPFEKLRIYGYVSGLNIVLWKAEKGDDNPIFPNGRIDKTNISIGVSANF